MRVAVLDDDPIQLELMGGTIAGLDHSVHAFSDGRSLLRAFRRESFDMLILDWQLPDISGIEVLRWMRMNLEERVPVLMVTNRTAEEDVIEGLRAGADDFMSKPIRAGELAARTSALLRRAYQRQVNGEFLVDRFRFQAAHARIYDGDIEVQMKQKEFDLAVFLFQNVGRLLSRKHLLEAVWGTDVELSSRSLDTHVSRLRMKLRLTPEYGYRLSAIYSVGYRLETVTPTAPSASADRKGVSRDWNDAGE